MRYKVIIRRRKYDPQWIFSWMIQLRTQIFFTIQKNQVALSTFSLALVTLVNYSHQTQYKDHTINPNFNKVSPSFLFSHNRHSVLECLVRIYVNYKSQIKECRLVIGVKESPTLHRRKGKGGIRGKRGTDQVEVWVFYIFMRD